MKPRDPIDLLLGTVNEPVRTEEYWKEFPEVIANQVRSLYSSPRKTRPPAIPVWDDISVIQRWIVGIVAGLTAVISLFLMPRIAREHRHDSMPILVPAPLPFASAELDGLRRIFLELSVLFPGQLQGLVFEGDQTRLVLSESPTSVSGSLAAVQICRPAGCFTAVTTAGQPVPVGHGVMDVFPDAKGGVLVVGPDFAWRSGEPLPSGYTIAVSSLEVSL